MGHCIRISQLISVLLLFIILYQSIHLPPLIRGQSVRGGRSLNFPAQTSFFPATSSSSCGETPRHSKASRESLPKGPEHFIYYYFLLTKICGCAAGLRTSVPGFHWQPGCSPEQQRQPQDCLQKSSKRKLRPQKWKLLLFLILHLSPALTRLEKKRDFVEKAHLLCCSETASGDILLLFCCPDATDLAAIVLFSILGLVYKVTQQVRKTSQSKRKSVKLPDTTFILSLQNVYIKYSTRLSVPISKISDGTGRLQAQSDPSHFLYPNQYNEQEKRK